MSAAETLLETLRAHGVTPTRLALDSRAVAPGDVFIALPGAQSDGRAYIAEALARGAAAVLAEADAGQAAKVGAGGTAPIIEVERLAQCVGELAHLVYGRPSERLWLCGVTGTNGKTSVSQWIAQAMNALGCKCGVIGTLGLGIPPALETGRNTTPDAITLNATRARFVREGALACAMEVSSIGLDQGRVDGAHFDVAVLTNLTRDHLEYHGSMEAYAAAKAKLFAAPGLGHAVLNLDDPFGRELADKLKGRVATIGYTLEGRAGADRVLAATDVVESGQGLAFTVEGVRIAAPVVGRFNAANLLAVTGALLAGDETLADIAAALREIKPPPGRMQTLGGAAAPLIVV
ncbi:MAG: UDP-N-acetylmuramyl-tripeptide synthetase, partial [Rhodocyclaceae bacterium]|nr:UDP-N-acetylmuramyl-tripeptide synthetase [Rhodocyclaceae bacterium]